LKVSSSKKISLNSGKASRANGLVPIFDTTS
jgi:hypothetical protein